MAEGGRQLGVLDVGCFSAHLLVVADHGLRPVLDHKVRLRLDQALDDTARVRRKGVEQVVAAVRQSLAVAERAGVRHIVPYATSVLRDAPNAPEVFAEIAAGTGVALHVLSGAEEARLSYLAARRWFGAGAGPLLVLDIGGGTVEVAAGDAAEPAVVGSLPYGARALTRRPVPMKVVRRQVRDLLGDVRDHRAVGCSKVFQQLARLAGARPQRDGVAVPRSLDVTDLRRWIPRLASMPPAKRAALPGISRHRAEQAYAGAVVAETLMRATGHDEVVICPWSSREGLLLTLLDDAGNGACRVA
ncbi:Ppx/GppA phosphatase family protein [Saccharothrix variisporea]|uniref:Exopolyphosphatase/guanosine-5'-triphosphate, 3'-diphosphate pyrophosphatase n=1 Tax=Saccharothrix variisporea TaxID=543527 RepID=A0A495XQR4_9PSEU|nr:exopolyphosphatase [Saccharothrix variisporea]RKT73998.1 exopolyphosphatase/guanosine-5'-triphosphate,3'-diphosphate pyrophosphatase [Saccharothrix variisporea]